VGVHVLDLFGGDNSHVLRHLGDRLFMPGGGLDIEVLLVPEEEEFFLVNSAGDISPLSAWFPPASVENPAAEKISEQKTNAAAATKNRRFFVICPPLSVA
jgi:hypothetical protein